MQEKKILISIFTPTYNRGKLLKRLYESIKNQDYNNFEWIIVDDGSSDNTKKIVKSFADEKIINIKYIYQENSGKHIAINNGVLNAKGEYFLIVDSDDYLVKNILKKIADLLSKISDDNHFAGIGGLKIYKDSSIIGKSFKGDFLDCTTLERNKNNIKGDKAEIFKTEVLKKYPFPKIDNEKFMPEAYVWNKIAADGYLIRWYNVPFIVCEYLDDGFTKNKDKLIKNNPKGHLLYISELIKVEKSWIRNLAHKSSYYKYGKVFYSDSQIMSNLKIGIIQFFIIKIISKIRGK